jgi:hypothetical protein
MYNMSQQAARIDPDNPISISVISSQYRDVFRESSFDSSRVTSFWSLYHTPKWFLRNSQAQSYQASATKFALASVWEVCGLPSLKNKWFVQCSHLVIWRSPARLARSLDCRPFYLLTKDSLILDAPLTIASREDDWEQTIALYYSKGLHASHQPAAGCFKNSEVVLTIRSSPISFKGPLEIIIAMPSLRDWNMLPAQQ